MRNAVRVAALAVFLTTAAHAQAPGKWPPDSLINTKVIPKTTPPIQVVGTMRNFAGDLGALSGSPAHVAGSRAQAASRRRNRDR